MPTYFQTPYFADIDFGFDGDLAGSSDFVGNVHTIVSGAERARSMIAFPGVSGSIVNTLGARSRRIIWIYTIIAKTETILGQFMRTLEGYHDYQAWTLACKGRVFTNVVLKDIQPIGPGPEGNWEPVYEPGIYNAGPMVMQILRLEFQELTPI
jgi:hypothetical protein